MFRLQRSICVFAASALLLGTSTAFAATVTLANGDTLEVEAIEPLDDGVRVTHPVLGVLTLPASALAPAAADVAAVSSEPPADPPDPGAFGSGWLRDWDRQIALGVSGARGNSDNLDVTAGLTLGFEDDHKRWAIALRYFYSEAERVATKDQGHLDVTRDFLFPGERYFTFATLRWDVDDFQAWDHRGTVGGGVGWTFADTETFAFRGRTGLAVTRTFGGIDEETDYEWMLGVETEWAMNEFSRIKAYNTLFPSLKDTGEFRNLTGITADIDLAGESGLGLQLGVENEYISDVVAPTERNDLQYFANLVYDF